MNICVAILLAAALLGVVDKAAGGRLGLAAGFDRGVQQMGSLCVSMTGFYCAATALCSLVMDSGAVQTGEGWFDPSLPVCMALAVDMGGWNAAAQMASSPQLAAFTGLLVASTVGCLVSFSLPVAVGFLDKEEIPGFMQGVLWGVLALPFGLGAGGLVLGLDPWTLLRNLAPVAGLCAVLAVMLFLAPGVTGRIFSAFGAFVHGLGILLFGLVVVSVFFEGLLPLDSGLPAEAVMTVFRITVIVCGANICSDLALARCGGFLDRCARRLGVAPVAVVGLAASAISSISMLPSYRAMDDRGKAANAAFCAAGAYVIGGQLAFVSSVAGNRETAAFLVCKLVSGVLAVVLVGAFGCPRPAPKEQAREE